MTIGFFLFGISCALLTFRFLFFEVVVLVFPFSFHSVFVCFCNICCSFRVVQGKKKILGEVNQRGCGVVTSLIRMMIREVHCLSHLLILRIVSEGEGLGLALERM